MANANSVVFELILKSKTRIDLCGDFKMPTSFYIEGESIRKSLGDFKSNSGITPRWIIEITKENVDYSKKLMEIADLRHLKKLKWNFILNEKEYVSFNLRSKKGKITPHFIHSAIKEAVEQQQYVFDAFWEMAIPAKEKINEIEGKNDDAFQLDRYNNIVKVIRGKGEIESLSLSCICNARSEVLIAISSIQLLDRLYKIGLEGSIKHAKTQGSTIVLLYPENEITEMYKGENTNFQSIIDNIKNYAQIKSVSGFIGNLILIDNSKMLTINTGKVKDSPDNDFGVYTDNKSIVSNFGSLFDTLLNEQELLNSIIEVKNQLELSNRQLLESNERLRINSNNQEEFINIAAHELRSVTQVILGFAEMMEKDPNNNHNRVKSILRNAAGLKRLVEDLLDVAKIESNNLLLYKEKVNLMELLSILIHYAKTDLEYKEMMEKGEFKKDNNKYQLEKKEGYIDIFLFPEERHLENALDPFPYVRVDRGKIIQAITNILNNSIKSIGKDGGKIIITVSTEGKEKNNSFQKNQIVVSFRDTGKGIDSKILPRLFDKFATNSVSGTGLGLYLTKKIIEAHGGKIWAENNVDGKGATFSFSLPTIQK